MQRFSIRSLLVLLVIAVALPLAGLLVYITHLRVEARATFVRELARGAVDASRAMADGLIDDARELLARLARGECADLPRQGSTELPPGLTVAMVDSSGRVLCSAGSHVAVRDASLADDPGFQRMLQARAFAVGDFAMSPLTGRWSLLLYHPGNDRAGVPAGAAVAVLDHSRFDQVLRGTRQDFMDSVAVVMRDGGAWRVVTTSTVPGGNAGRELQPWPDLNAIREGRTDILEIRGFDGRERIGAVQRMPATGWYVFAGLDRERVMASIYRQQNAIAAAFVAVIAVALLIGFWLSTRIASPLRALAQAAPSALAGADGETFARTGPKEVVELAARLGDAIRGHLEAVASMREMSAQAQSFLDSSPVAYVRCDTAGKVVLATDRWKVLFADPGTDPTGRAIESYVPGLWERCRRYVEGATGERDSRILEHEQPTRAGIFAFVTTLFPVRNTAGLVTGVGMLSLDVTGLKAVEHERERLNLILTRVTEAVPLCLSYIDADNRYVWTNARNGERLGHAPEWIVGRTAREVYGRQFQEISDGAILVRRGNSVREERAWQGADGVLREYEHILVPDLDPEGGLRGHTAMWLDITERKAAQQREHEYAERMQVLSRRLIDAQEAERRTVARELHDGVGQQLTAVLFMLRSLHGAAESPEAAARLDEGADLVNAAIDGVRNTSLQLRPSILDDLGLVPALRWLVEQQARLTHIDMTLELGNLSSDVPSRTATGCFRIVQEAITNAVRHARSGRIRVRLQEAGGGIELEVEDDGTGFDLEAARKRASEGGSSGLTGMRERAELLGGTCWVQAEPGLGTKIRAALPFAA